MLGPQASRNFYRYVKSYSSKEKPEAFDVWKLFEKKSDPEILEDFADHFSGFSADLGGIANFTIPEASSAPLTNLTLDEVAKKLKSFRKPRSMVPGDIFPSLVDDKKDILAIPLIDMFNLIFCTLEWLQAWMTDYVKAIPTKSHPQSLNDLRNISCTRLFLKVYESYVLAWLGGQVGAQENQYGGLPGVGTEHFLVHTWQKRAFRTKVRPGC